MDDLKIKKESNNIEKKNKIEEMTIPKHKSKECDLLSKENELKSNSRKFSIESKSLEIIDKYTENKISDISNDNNQKQIYELQDSDISNREVKGFKIVDFNYFIFLYLHILCCQCFWPSQKRIKFRTYRS